MKNKFYIIIFTLIFYLGVFYPLNASEQFNFDVTEIEITENGNIFKGLKRGLITTQDGVFINANSFIYNKSLNKLDLFGDVRVEDKLKDIIIFSEEITYLKEKEFFYSKKKSKAINKETIIDANEFSFNKELNILNAKGDVAINNKIKDVVIFSKDITYLKNKEKIFTKGNTKSVVESKYEFISDDVIFLKNKMELSSINESLVYDDNSNQYKLKNFRYLINQKLLKGEDIEIITNFLKQKSDKFHFLSGIFDFQKNSFISKDTKILLHKNVFESERVLIANSKNKFINENDPRIYGVSSSGNDEKTIINKGIFTSCSKNEECPSWSIKSKKITHDKIKKQLIYDDAVLNIYDVPVLYFPKFFHPDPSVKRQSGFLQPRLNNSNILGTSINIPYFHVISDDKDLTIKPTIYDNRIYTLQNEYRQENKNSSFIADFAFTKGYKSSNSTNKNSLTHLFSKFDIDLGLDNFSKSKLNLFLEKTSNDTYLKIFENTLITDDRLEEDLKDTGNLTSGAKLLLDHNNYNFTAGINSYENLSQVSSDRYQYVMPYYDFNQNLYTGLNGSLNFTSNGDNKLINTNNLKTRVINSLNFKSSNIISKTGFLNNYGVYIKNLNTVAKNDSVYKSSPQAELLNMYEVSSSFPLIKNEESATNIISPKVSFRINPGDMKNHTDNERLITTSNAFSIDRLGLVDSYESGKSLTIGIDYKKESLKDSNKEFEIKLASILRDTKEDSIPKSSTANRKNSNLFGTINSTYSDLLTLNYDFSVDNDLKSFEYNSVGAKISVNNFVTEFNFLEKNGEVGEKNILENSTKLEINKNNNLLFKTRRNRKINLTEYYDLIYEYQNDCLTAGVKYRKTYYEDRDLKPEENLMFTISFYPLTSIEQSMMNQ